MTKYIAVVNSTPIIMLHKVGYLDLLNLVYGKIYIPKAVYKEVITNYGINKDDDFISANSFIEIVEIQKTPAGNFFSSSLHEGEVETILLAMEKKADFCILDDLLARKYAKNAGFEVTGTLGVLITAKNKGYIKEVNPIMDKLIDEGMYVDKELYSSVLSIAKES